MEYAEPVIKEVRLENFMSHRYTRVKFNSGVNLIIGPNGAGKSSILLGISVGLGQSYTERGRRLSDLIRHGEDIGRVTIVVSNEPRNGVKPFPNLRSREVFITRYLRRDGTYWFEANGRQISRSELQRGLMRIGLNPENMLIVMHQGLVEQFAYLSPQERLVIVEDAVGLGSFRRGILAAMQELGEVVEKERKTMELLQRAEEALKYWDEQYQKYLRLMKLREELSRLRGELAWALVKKREKEVEDLRQELSRVSGEIEKYSAEIRKLHGEIRLKLSRADELERKVLEGAVKLVSELKNLLLSYGDLLAEARVREYVVAGLKEEEKKLRMQLKKLAKKLEEEIGEAESLSPRIDTPRSPEEIEEEIRRIELEIASLGEVPSETLEAYEKYKAEYEEIRKRAIEAAENRERLQKDIEERKRIWRDRILKVVEEVNKQYQSFLARVGGVGEVRLVNVEDIEAAGLNLTAGFRGIEPVELNPYTLSGGERIAAIMCFLLALQSHIKSPFRAIDEFEVHMDPQNRAAILNIIFELSRENPDVEYIVISPQPFKPLPENTTVIVVQKVRGVSYVQA